jgi:hypothetical protein
MASDIKAFKTKLYENQCTNSRAEKGHTDKIMIPTEPSFP